MVPSLLFYMFATALLLSASGVVFIRNPLYCVLCLIVAFFNAAGLFLLTGAEFLALILVIVYVGAVAVLFLFVVMMLDISKENNEEKPLSPYIKATGLLAFVFAIELGFTAHQWWHSTKINDLTAFSSPLKTSNTHALGELLYTHYFYVFQMAGLTLLVAMIGAIVLTLHPYKKQQTKKQDISKQLKRSKENGLKLVKIEFHKGLEK
ncbi:MAG: NADH-quinone oxidoreductase subunit J [Alphaproteobacteria bacterium]|nr:NADH-quinone oxidoreductase subunit J [Alphaproteobacteria bacterium]